MQKRICINKATLLVIFLYSLNIFFFREIKSSQLSIENQLPERQYGVDIVILCPADEIKNNAYPFKSDPKLSWADYERDLRKKHYNVSIPHIVFDPNLITDTESSESYHTQDLDMFVLSQYPNQTSAEWPILHEAGHHNYNKLQREANHARAHKITQCAKICIATIIYGTNAALLYSNSHDIYYNQIPIAGFIAQTFAITLFFKRNNIKEFISNQIQNRVGVKPEEYWADTFANEHASKEGLLAAQYRFSKQASYDKLIENYKNQPKSIAKRKEILKKYNREAKVAPFVIQLCQILSLYYYYSSYLFDPAHPTRKERHHNITKTLKERFTV